MSTFNINTAKKEDVSIRLKQHNIKRAKDETKKLETESRKMEEKLKELRMAMNREKEEREKQGGGFWSRGQTGKLGSYATDVLNKPTKSSKDPSKRKVKVLKESPLDIPERSSQPGTFGHLAKQSISNTPREKIKGPKCGQCEEKRAMVSCVQCSEHYCAQCFAAFHLKGALKKHRSVPLSASGPRQCMSPRPTPPPSNREYHNGYHSGEGAVNSLTIHHRDRNSPEGASGSFDGPSLLDGDYDEAENAASFQQAVLAWRNGEASSEAANEKPKVMTPRRISPRKTQRTPRETVSQMDHSTGTVQRSPELDIKFTNSLSYAERLMLKKHRRTEVDELTTPRLGTPRTSGTGSTTPRAQLGFNTEDSFDMDEPIERVEFRALYEAATANKPKNLARHDEDNISIIEIQSDETPSNRRKQNDIEERSECKVQEADDLDTWAIKTNRSRKFNDQQETFQDTKPPAPIPKSASRKQREKTDLEMQERVKSSRGTEKLSLESDVIQSSQMERETSNAKRPPSAKQRPTSSRPTSSRPTSSRPSSRAKTSQSRPGSRAKSRASSRMMGEGHITMEPSTALKQIASLPLDDLVPTYSSGLGDFLMTGVTPAQQEEKVIIPSKHKKSANAQEKYKLSYTFYSMSPRSWKQDNSVSDSVPAETVQCIETPRLADPEDPVAALEAAQNSAEVHRLGSKQGQDLLSQYGADFDKENNTKKVIDGSSSPTPSARSISRVDSWLRETTLPALPDDASPSVKEDLSIGLRSHSNVVKSPRPKSSASQSHRQKTPRPISQLSKTSKTPRPSSQASVTPRTASQASVTPRPESQTSESPRPSSQASVTPRPRSQASRTPRPESKTLRPLSRLRSSFAEDGRASRAIVVDGEDLTRFDNMDVVENSNQEDTETLDKLEWELASQSGRITADGQISRMSMLEDDQMSTSSIDSHRSFSRMSQQDQGYDINTRLREDELMEDEGTDEEHDLDEQDVKALK